MEGVSPLGLVLMTSFFVENSENIRVEKQTNCDFAWSRTLIVLWIFFAFLRSKTNMTFEDEAVISFRLNFCRISRLISILR